MVSTSRKMYIWTRLFVWLIFTSFVLFVNFSFCLHQMYQTTGMQTLSHRNTLWVNRTRATFCGGKWEKLLVKLYISTALRNVFQIPLCYTGVRWAKPQRHTADDHEPATSWEDLFFPSLFFYLVWTRCAYFSTYFSNVFHFYTAHSTFTHRNAIIANL